MAHSDSKPKGRPDFWHFVAEVPEEQGRTAHRDWILDFREDLSLGGVSYGIAAPVSLSVDLCRDGMGVRMAVGVKTTVIARCCRCLSSLELALDENFMYRYVSQSCMDKYGEEDGQSEDVVMAADLGRTLDVSDALWECLIVSMPPFPVCPGGCDLAGPVTSEENGEASDPRFQILARFDGGSCKGGNSNGNSKEQGISQKDS